MVVEIKALYVSGVQRNMVGKFRSRGYEVKEQLLVSKDFKDEGLMDIIVTHEKPKRVHPRALKEVVKDGCRRATLYQWKEKGEGKKEKRASPVVMLQVAFCGRMGQVSEEDKKQIVERFNAECGTAVHYATVVAQPNKSGNIVTIYLDVGDEATARSIANPFCPKMEGVPYELRSGIHTTLHTLQRSPKPKVYKPNTTTPSTPSEHSFDTDSGVTHHTAFSEGSKNGSENGFDVNTPPAYPQQMWHHQQTQPAYPQQAWHQGMDQQAWHQGMDQQAWHQGMDQQAWHQGMDQQMGCTPDQQMYPMEYTTEEYHYNQAPIQGGMQYKHEPYLVQQPYM